jgi:NDP-hexose-3-ketoreductase
MNVLIIGYSSLVRRRVLPALVSLPEVEKIFIASRGAIPSDVLPPKKRGGVFQGYAEALSSCKPCLAYVSLPNSLHAEWASKALHAGFHVIVDKPSVTEASDADAIVKLSALKNLCLAEANVWHYHPLTETLKNVLASCKSAPAMALAIFSSPRANPLTVHYDLSLGGGILYDRGSYAISCGKMLFGGVPQEVICRSLFVDQKLDISCTIMLRYANGSTLLSFLSLDAEYQNTLSVVGSTYRLEVQRIFTPPADYKGVILSTRANVSEDIVIPAADIFALFISDVLNSIKKKSFRHFSQTLLEDANVMQNLRISAFGG